jgi:hypothetical protein
LLFVAIWHPSGFLVRRCSLVFQIAAFDAFEYFGARAAIKENVVMFTTLLGGLIHGVHFA